MVKHPNCNIPTDGVNYSKAQPDNATFQNQDATGKVAELFLAGGTLH